MSSSYQRNTQDDFDEDGAEAMEYEPSEQSLGQKSLLDEIPEPWQYECNDGSYEPPRELAFVPSHFDPERVHKQRYPSTGENSQNVSSSFLNLSDSVSQKANVSRNMNDGSLETAANLDSQTKHNWDNFQELHHQVVELKRQISLKDQDLTYSRQRNEKLANELKRYQSVPSEISGQNAANIHEENTFLREKWVNSESKITQMEEYIQSLIENNEEEQLVQLLKSEKEAVSQLQQEKNELLEYIESFLKEQESTEQLLQSLQKENSQLKEEIQARFRSSSNMESEYTQNFDTFGGEGEDTLTKNKLQEAQETIENLQKQLNNLKQTRTIENKSKETDIQNLTEKLRISEANNEKSSRAIADAEEHFKKEIEAIRASGRTTGEDLKKITQAKDQAELSLKSLKQDHGELQAKFRKIQDNYAALETTCNETQAELEEIREKYDQDIEKIANDLQDSEKRIQLEQLENKWVALKNMNKQQEETIESKTKKISELTSQWHDLNSTIRELENGIDKLSRENSTLSKQLKQSKDVSESSDYVELLKQYDHLKDNFSQKEAKYKEMNHDFGKKLKEIERLSQDYSECKHSLQDLKYRYNNLELQKQDKEEKLRQMNTKNDNLTSELQIVKENDQKNATSKIQEFKKKIKTLDDDNSALQKLCKINKDKANKCASLVDEFNEDFLSYAKETHFDKKLISRKYRDFIILADKIKPAKQADQIQDVLEKIEDWISHSAEEFEIQMKNAANFKKKYLNVSERVDQLEDHQMNLKNGENRWRRREEALRKEVSTLTAKLDQIESEKSCSFKREGKSSKQLQGLKQDLKSISKENQKLISQLKSLTKDKERLERQLRDADRIKGCENGKIKDLESRTFQLLYEKESITEMLSTLERSIPSTEVQRLFSEYISSQKQLFSLEEEKNKSENELLCKEKKLRATAKEEKLSSTVIDLRKEVELMRKNLSTIEGSIEEANLKNSSLKDELHWVEIHEKRRNDVIFETERTLLEKREENERLKREVNYLSNSKTDVERAYHAMVEEKKIIDRELMMIKAHMGTTNPSECDERPNTFYSTLNPGDFTKNRLLQGQNYIYSQNLSGNDTSNFVSPEIDHKYASFYPNQWRDSYREGDLDQYESEGEGASEGQILEQSYEAEPHFPTGEELSIKDKLQQVKETFHSIKSSIHL